MRTIITIDIDGGEQAVKKLKNINKDLKGDRLKEAWERAVELLGAEARALAPYWQGNLKASIDEEVGFLEEDLVGMVFTDLIYAPPQERGTAPYWPNIDNLQEWADDKGLSVFVVARSISEKGLPPREFFKEAVVKGNKEVFDLIGYAVAEILEQWED